MPALSWSREPSGRRMFRVCASWNEASPGISVTPAAISCCSSRAAWFSMMRCLRLTASLRKPPCTGPREAEASRMPRAAKRDVSQAASRSALLGMVPVCRLTPPSLGLRSISPARLPSAAACSAALCPPGPEPTTRMSKSCRAIHATCAAGLHTRASCTSDMLRRWQCRAKHACVHAPAVVSCAGGYGWA